MQTALGRTVVVLCTAFIFSLLLLACGEPPEANLQSKAAEVDSVWVKGVKVSKSYDSLRTVQKELARQYTEGVRLEKVTGDDLLALASMYQVLAEYEKEQETLKSYLAEPAEQDSLAAARLFWSYIYDTKPEQAESFMKGEIEKHGVEPGYNQYYRLSYSFYEIGQLDKAEQWIDKTIEASPTERNYPYVSLKAEIVAAKGDMKGARRVISEGVKGVRGDDKATSYLKATLKRLELPGKLAPAFLASEWIDAEPLSIHDLRGKIVLIDFWAPSCGPCRATFPHLREWYSKYHDLGFEIIGLTRYYGRFNQLGQTLQEISPEEELEWIRKFKAHHEIPFPYAVATQEQGKRNSDAYGVKGIPTVVLMDKEGIVWLVVVGSGEKKAEQIEEKIQELLGT